MFARIRNQLTLCSLQKQLQETNCTLIEQNRRLQEATRETRLLLKATWAIGRSPNFRVAIGAVLDAVCENILWEYGEAWLPDPDRNVLEYIANPVAKNGGFARFQEDSSRRTFARGQGIAGRIWLSEQPEWIEDCSLCSPDIYDRADMARVFSASSPRRTPLQTASCTRPMSPSTKPNNRAATGLWSGCDRRDRVKFCNFDCG